MSEYRLSTVSVVSKYGLDWSAVRFGLVPKKFVVLLDACASESHAKQYSDSALIARR